MYPTFLTDAQWELIEPLIPGKAGDPGRTGDDNRRTVEAIFHKIRQGCTWRGLPREFGPWHTVYTRYRRWVKSGVIARIFESTKEGLDMSKVQVDGTICQAHKQSAGARRNGLTPKESAEKQGLGRSKGGFTTKIVFAIATTSKIGQVFDFALLPGQRHDIKGIPELAEDADIEEYIADRGFDSDQLRQDLINQGITPTIPPRKNRKETREYDEVSYRDRNRVERIIGHLKEFRSIATRYEKLAESYGGFVKLVCWHYATKHLRL